MSNDGLGAEANSQAGDRLHWRTTSPAIRTLSSVYKIRGDS